MTLIMANLDLTSFPKFKYGNTTAIAAATTDNYAILIDTTSGNAYVDLNNSRITLSSIVRIASSSNLPSTGNSKVYLTEDTGDFYYYASNTWKKVSSITTESTLTNSSDKVPTSAAVYAAIGDIESALAALL